MGFEPTRAKPNGLAGRRLNHSAKVSYLKIIVNSKFHHVPVSIMNVFLNTNKVFCERNLKSKKYLDEIPFALIFYCIMNAGHGALR